MRTITFARIFLIGSKKRRHQNIWILMIARLLARNQNMAVQLVQMKNIFNALEMAPGFVFILISGVMATLSVIRLKMRI